MHGIIPENLGGGGGGGGGGLQSPFSTALG